MRSKYFIIALLTVLIIAIGGWLLYRQFVSQPTAEQAPLRSNPEVERAYERDLGAILQPFWSSNNPAGLREQVLALSTPAKYLDLHLDIVLAFDLIEQGQLEADQAKIEEGIDRLHQLREQNGWLK